MATEIDKRVVQMEFDNKDFERNCQASLTTLEKLKMALNFDGAKGLDSMAKAADKIDLSNLSKGAEAVSVKFSAMQVAGMTAISELTKGLMNFGKKVWDSSFGLMKTGGMARTLKIEQARFQMAALAKNMKGITEDAEAQAALVEKMVKAASESVSGTAYGMDAAAAVTSQLMASGVMNSETMLNHLRGIAGAAAMTGRSFEDIGNIFTTVASNGRLMTMQLRQFSAAGLNLSATLGQSLGKSEDEINEMVRKGEISFEQFSKALSDAFGDAATKADDTFSGVTTNIQAQIKRIGQIFTDPFVEHVVPFLKEVKSAIKRINEVMQPLGKTFEMVFSKTMKDASKTLSEVSMERIRGILHGIENIFAGLVAIIMTIGDALKTLFPPKTADELEGLAISFESFTRNLMPSKETLDGLRQVLILLFSPLRLIYNIFLSLWKNAIKPLLVVITKLLGSILRLGKALKPFTDKLVESLTNFKFLDSVLQLTALTIAVVIDWVTQFIDAFGKLLNMIASSETIKEFAATLQSIGNIIGNVIVGALYLLYTVVSSILSVLNIDNITNSVMGLGDAFEILVYFIDMVGLTIMSLIDGLANSSTLFREIWSIVTNFIETIKAFFTGQDYTKNIDNIGKSFANLGDQLKLLADKFQAFIKEIDVGYIMLLVFAGAVIFLFFSIKNLVDASTRMVNGAANFTGIFTQIKNSVMKMGRANAVLQTLVGISVAIATFTSAVKTIKDIPLNDLIKASVVIGVFTLAMMGFSVAMTILQNQFALLEGKQMIGLFGSLLALSVSILMLSVAIKSIVGVESELKDMVTPFGLVIGLMAGLVGAAIAISQLAGPASIGAISMIGFALSIKILITAINQISKLNLETVETNLWTLIKLMLSFGSALAIAGLAGFGFGAGMGFLGAALSLLIVLGILKKIANADFEEIKKGFMALAGLLTPLLAFIGIVTVVLKLFGYGSLLKELSGLIMQLNLSMISMMIMVGIFSKIPKEELSNAVGAVGILGFLLALMLKVLLKPLTSINITGNKLMVTSKTIKGIGGLLLSLAIMMTSIGLMVSMISGHLEGFLPALMLISLVMAGLTSMLKLLMNEAQHTANAKVGPILAVTSGIMMILSSIVLMATLIPMDRISTFETVAMWSCLAMLAFAAVIGVYAKLSKEQVGAFTRDTTKRSSDQTLAIAASIVAVIGALGLITYAVLKLSPNENAIAGMNAFFAMVVAAFIAIAVFIRVADDSTRDTAKFTTRTAAISGMFYSIAAFIAAFGFAISSVLYVSKDISFGRFAATVGILTVALGILVALGIRLTEFVSTDFSGADLVKASLSLFSLAGAFSIIAAVLTVVINVLSTVPPATIIATTLSLAAGMFIMLGGLSIMLHNAKNTYKDGMFSDSKQEAANLKDVAAALFALAGAFAIIATAIIGISLSTKLLSKNEILKTAALWAMILVSIAGMMIGMGVLVNKVGTQDSKDFSKIALSLVIASSSFAIIAASIVGLALLTKDISGGKLIAISVALSIAIAALIGMMILLLNFDSVYRDGKTYLAIAGSIAIAALAVAIIAHSIKTISSIRMKKNSWQPLVAMGAYLVLIGGFMALMIGLQKNNPMTGPMLLAVAGSFLVAASAIVMLAQAIKIISEVTSGPNIEAVNDTMKQIAILFGILLGLSILTTVVVKIFDVGRSLAIAFGVIFGAIALFSASVLMFAESMSAFADAAKKFNDVELDSNKIQKNLAEAITGFSEGLKTAVKPILEFAGVIILGIMAILAAQKVKMALMGVVWFSAFVVGIAAAMPVLLAAFDSIIDSVLEYFEDPKVMEKWKRFFETIGELLGTVILGSLEGLLAAIGITLADFEEKINAYNENKEKQAHDFNRTIGDSEVMGHAFRNTSLGEEGDSLGQNLLYLNEQRKYLESLEKGTQEYDNARGFYTNLRDSAIAQLSQMTHDDWVKTAEYLNQYAESMAAAGEKVSTEMMEQVDYLKRISPEDIQWSSIFDGFDEAVEHGEFELEQLNSSMTNMSNNTVRTITRDSEAIEGQSESIKKAADATKESSDSMEKSSKSIEKSASKTEKSMNKTVESVESTSAFDMGNFVSNLTTKVTAGIAQVKENMNNPEMGGLFEQIGGMFGNIFGTSFSSEAGDTITDSLFGEAAPDYLKSLGFGSMKEDLEEAKNSFADFSDGVSDSTENAKRKIDEFRDSVHDSIASAMHGIFDEVKEQEYIDPEEMLYRMSENVRQVGEWARNIATLAARGMSEGLLNELKDMGPQGAAKVQAFVDMTDEQLQMANRRWKAAEFMPDYGTKEIENAYKKAGFNASLGFKEGVDATMASDAMSEFADAGLNTLEDKYEINSPSKRTARDGEYAAMGFAVGLNSPMAQTMLRGATLKIANLVLETLDRELRPQKFQEAANNIFDGFANGMANRIPQILSKVTLFCSQLIATFQRVLRMHSPSKAMEDLGYNAMAGFGNGMEEGSEEVMDVTDQSANDILDQMKANIAAVANGWSEDNVYQPVIRPVFDMDAINQGYSDIQSWFANSQGINLNGSISRLTPTTRDEDASTQQVIDAINRINNDDVVREIGALRDDISNLQSAITSMQVVLNTGTLVGQLVEPIDRALGSKALYNSRGRY